MVDLLGNPQPTPGTDGVDMASLRTVNTMLLPSVLATSRLWEKPRRNGLRLEGPVTRKTDQYVRLPKASVNAAPDGQQCLIVRGASCVLLLQHPLAFEKDTSEIGNRGRMLHQRVS